MSQFTDPLRMEHLDGKHYRIIDGFRYHVGSENSDEIITVPAGFITDFQTIPPCLWPLFGYPTDAYAATGAGHDQLYGNPANGVDEPRSRRRCDQIFLEMNKVLGCPWWKRTGKYAGVRIGGRKGWVRYRKKEWVRAVAEACKGLYRESE